MLDVTPNQYEDLTIKIFSQIIGMLVIDLEFVLENTSDTNEDYSVISYMSGQPIIHYLICKSSKPFPLSQRAVKNASNLFKKLFAVQEKINSCWIFGSYKSKPVSRMIPSLRNKLRQSSKMVSKDQINLTQTYRDFSGDLEKNIDFFFVSNRIIYCGNEYCPFYFLSPVSLTFFMKKIGLLDCEENSITLDVVIEDPPIISIEI
jgi:hypothetical protein